MFFRSLIVGILLVLVGIYVGIVYETPIKRWFAAPWPSWSWCPECALREHSHENVPKHTHEWVVDHTHDQVYDPTYDPSFESDVRWLALNMYYHRGERNTDRGRKAVTAVVLNRLTERNHYFGPRSIRGIITFGYEPGKCTCNFSWYCDGKDDVPDDPRRFDHDRRLAAKWLSQFHAGTFEDPTYGATWFIYKRAPYPQNWPDLEWTSEHGEYAFYRYP